MTAKHHATKAPQVPAALLSESLMQKSKAYAKRALAGKQGGNDDDYQLYAALALELLAKSSLSAIHPSLVVKTDNLNSLLEANGISTGTAVRTIDASEAYARLRHTVSSYTTPDMEACRKLADRRNAELHSGEAAFAAFPPRLWEGEFWHAAELVLKSMTLTLDDWLGADAKTPKELLAALRKAKNAAVQQRIERAKVAFEEFKPDEKKKRSAKQIKQILEDSKKLNPYGYQDIFVYSVIEKWLDICPACGAHGVVGGEEAYEEPAEDQSDAEPGYEIVEIGYYPLEFHCPTCGLALEGNEEVTMAGIGDDAHYVLEHREIQYEPDYGND
ncbi:hypothetical protein [Lysobacter fragariae]